MKKSTKQLVSAALLAALVCVATMVIKIPSPFKGYVNLGDCVVLLCGWMLSPVYGFLSAGIGSMFADIFSGYAVYAPATFVIKGLTALMACMLFRVMHGRTNDIFARIVGAIIAETVMVFGYLLFEGIMYGFAPSLLNVPANAVQGVAGIILGTVLIKVFEKTKIKI